ncbi:hypothetical protein ES703_32457 [subsurface metagenome]
MTNLFRQAKEFLDKKDAGSELSEEELRLINTVMAFVANKMPKAFPEYDERTVSEDLEEVAKFVEGGDNA